MYCFETDVSIDKEALHVLYYYYFLVTCSLFFFVLFFFKSSLLCVFKQIISMFQFLVLKTLGVYGIYLDLYSLESRRRM